MCQKIQFEGIFKKTVEQLPEIPAGGFIVLVYFIVDGELYQGHFNGQSFVHLYGVALVPYSTAFPGHLFCFHWCYTHELKFENPI